MNLNNDLKWKIFTLNAVDTTVDMQRRLQTTIATSQVCRDWRQILLSSSSIWGQLVCITANQSFALLEAIFLRSKYSPLGVEADFTLPKDMHGEHLELFFKIIEDHWERVEHLCVIMDQYSPEDEIYNRMLAAFDKPAPLLRGIMLKTPSFPKVTRTAVPAKLFNDEAPMLRVFDCVHIIPSNRSWLKNLSALHFTPTSISQVMTVLTTILTLEVLKISSYDYSSQSETSFLSNRQPVFIPSSLKSFSLVTTLDMFLNIWPLIASPSSATPCTISQTICFVGTDMPMRQYKQRIIEELNRIGHYHDDLDPPPQSRKLSIDITPKTITLKREPYSEIIFGLLTQPFFNFQLMFLFFADVFPSIYENVTSLEIGCSLMKYRVPGDIKSSFLKMHSITHLTLGTIEQCLILSVIYSNCASAVSCLDTDMFAPLIFPNLYSIRVQRWTQEGLLLLDEYLYRRSNILQVPVKQLYIEVHSKDRPKEFQDFFCDIHDLQVTWDDGKMCS